MAFLLSRGGREREQLCIVLSLLLSLPADSSTVSKHAIDLKPSYTDFPYTCIVLNCKYAFHIKSQRKSNGYFMAQHKNILQFMPVNYTQFVYPGCQGSDSGIISEIIYKMQKIYLSSHKNIVFMIKLKEKCGKKLIQLLYQK